MPWFAGTADPARLAETVPDRLLASFAVDLVEFAISHGQAEQARQLVARSPCAGFAVTLGVRSWPEHGPPQRAAPVAYVVGLGLEQRRPGLDVTCLDGVVACGMSSRSDRSVLVRLRRADSAGECAERDERGL